MHTLAAFPTYNGSRSNGRAIWELANYSSEVDFLEIQSSGLTYTFNALWATALNNRESGITHFLMVHDDIQPLDAKWFEILHQEMAEYDAGVLSVVSPLKSSKGLTSTALDTDPWRPRRLTLKEIADRPVTFREPGLLINTGLMLVDLRQPWVDKVVFDINNGLACNARGRLRAYFEPEDWHFSRQLMQLGVKYYATRMVRLAHRGAQDFYNFGIGGWDTDHENATEE